MASSSTSRACEQGAHRVVIMTVSTGESVTKSRLCLLSMEEFVRIFVRRYTRNTTLLQPFQTPGYRSTRLARLVVETHGKGFGTMNVTYAGRGGAPMARSKCTWRCTPAAQRRARVKITLQTYSVMIYHAWARLSSTPVASMGYTRLYRGALDANVRACRSLVCNATTLCVSIQGTQWLSFAYSLSGR